MLSMISQILFLLIGNAHALHLSQYYQPEDNQSMVETELLSYQLSSGGSTADIRLLRGQYLYGLTDELSFGATFNYRSDSYNFDGADEVQGWVEPSVDFQGNASFGEFRVYYGLSYSPTIEKRDFSNSTQSVRGHGLTNLYSTFAFDSEPHFGGLELLLSYGEAYEDTDGDRFGDYRSYRTSLFYEYQLLNSFAAGGAYRFSQFNDEGGDSYSDFVEIYGQVSLTDFQQITASIAKPAEWGSLTYGTIGYRVLF